MNHVNNAYKILLVIILLICIAVVFFFLTKKTKRKSSLIVAIVSSVLSVILLSILVVVSLDIQFNSRSYLEDMTVQVPDSEVTLLIREWQFLLGSGAEVYLMQGNKKVYLGQAGGGDDGYCPFDQGKYEIFIGDGNTVTIKWLAIPDTEVWKEKVFELPSQP